MDKKLFFTFCLVLAGICLQAQQAVSTGGATITASSGSVTFSIGLVDYLHPSGISGFTTQGVQQPYEILMLSVDENAGNFLPECTVYPNPAQDILTLKLDVTKLDCLSYQLLDLNGKLLISGEILQNETSFSMEKLETGTYFLKVSGSNNEIKSFKIIKN